MDRFEEWLAKEIGKAKEDLRESPSYPDELDPIVKADKRALENSEMIKIEAYRHILENYERIKGDENEPCEKAMDYRDTQEYLLKCRDTIDYLKSYVRDKISMDEQDKQMLTNPNAYIEKCGALNALHDIKDLIERHMG